MLNERKRAAGRPARQSARSVRLTAEETRKLAAAAERLGTSTSELIREAVIARCDAVLAEGPTAFLDDIIGVIEGDASWPQARDSEAVFGEIVAEKLAKRRRIG